MQARNEHIPWCSSFGAKFNTLQQHQPVYSHKKTVMFFILFPIFCFFFVFAKILHAHTYVLDKEHLTHFLVYFARNLTEMNFRIRKLQFLPKNFAPKILLT